MFARLPVSRFLPAIFLVAGIGISSIICYHVFRIERERAYDLFAHSVRNHIDEIQKNISWHSHSLKIIGNYFLSLGAVHADDLERFSGSVMRNDEHSHAAGGGEDAGAPSAYEQGFFTIRDNRIDSVFRVRHSFSGNASLLPVATINDMTPAQQEIFLALARQAQQAREASFFPGSFFSRRAQEQAPEQLMALYPVYRSVSDSVPEGFAFSIMDIRHILGSSEARIPFHHVAFTALLSGHGAEKKIFETRARGQDIAAWNHIEGIDLNGTKITLSFLPSAHFVRDYVKGHAFVLFIGLLILTILFSLYLRETIAHLRELEIAHRKAQDASRLKNEFLATMSHEIRSPMSGVLGMAELLMETPLTPEQKSYTRTILSSGETLLNIIEDILDFSKIEADRLELDPVPVNMEELVDDVCALYAPKAREKALELAVRYTPGTEKQLLADPVRVRQILGNLVNNAIKFTDKGHIIVVVREEKRAQDRAHIANLVFSVRDTGIGISQEAQAKVFDKFVQADASTTRNFGGTGLGLSICRRLIEMMGGRISLESVKGKGSVFTFNLPLERHTESTVLPFRPPALRDVKVLVVDDLPVICTLVCEQLALSGMRCLSAESGEEALDLMRQAAALGDPYRIVIVDYLLPGMDGEMLARAVCDEPGLGNPCLVMLTAAGNHMSYDNCKDKGFSAYLSKPVRVRTLIETLTMVWRHHRAGKTGLIACGDSTPRPGLKHERRTLRGARVLVAEDSRINQAFVQEVLEQMECDITIVPHGRDAVAAVRNGAFDLVLMDCQMPVMDGFEAARQIRALGKQGFVREDLPIVALTANAMMGDRQRCLEAGMNDYLPKPVRTRDLKEKIYYWIRRERVSFEEDGAQDDAGHIGGGVAADAGAMPPGVDMAAMMDMPAIAEARKILRDKYDMMVDCYIEDVEAYIGEIEQAFARGDLPSIVRPAHTIKSTSRRMGAAAMADKARDLEAAAQSMPDAEGRVHSARIRDLLTEMAALLSYTRHGFREDKPV